ncbi:MAG: ribonuclease P protein component [Bacteroidales bacterium]|nr:ribonuclease P protein component [Bacteroidales bacterium]
MKFTLPKAERITKKSDFEKLFSLGKIIYHFPIKVQYLFLKENSSIVKVAFAVPKNKIKHAVDRNYMKRIMREAYRKQKYTLINELNHYSIFITFVYISEEKITYREMEQVLYLILQEIKNRYLTHCSI